MDARFFFLKIREPPGSTPFPYTTLFLSIFGTQFGGANHGQLLTAWSAGGVAGPVLVNYIREYQRDHGVPGAHAYDFTMYLMAGLLVIGIGRVHVLNSSHRCISYPVFCLKKKM